MVYPDCYFNHYTGYFEGPGFEIPGFAGGGEGETGGGEEATGSLMLTDYFDFADFKRISFVKIVSLIKTL